MTFTRIRTRQLLSLVCCGILASALIVSSISSEASAADAASSPKVSAELLRFAGNVRIYIALSSNELGKDIASRQSALLAEQANKSADARNRASANPYLFTEQERRAARSIEQLRNRALPAIRRAAAPDVAASESVSSIIKHGGGEVHSSTPLPNAITATVPSRMIGALALNPLVSTISPTGTAPHLMNSPIDGSETWHTNGLIGNGSSADGFGSPDFVAIDAGIRTTHLAFRSRLSGDPNNGPATGPSRITSPAGRVFFGGSEHGNTVAATVGNTDLTQPVWPYKKGLAYGIDKLYDPYQAKSGFFWLTGITYDGEPGVSDLPEAANYSSGLYEDTTDFNPVWIFIDNHIASFGITYSISGGNCGVEGGGFTGCSVMGQGPHRVSTPGNLHNTITVGGLDYNGDPYNSSIWIPWANSSPGPTWGGRKKPDLVADPNGVAGGPSQISDSAYENTGSGTSFAAPIASAGALLLSSTGVYQPTAQKAILINGATPIQSQTYWTPKSGWGALDLDAAYHQRANYADSTITPSTENGVRFFRATGVTSGDRSTLVWNRRTATSSTYRALTNLDLSQHDETTGATTSTGGSDASDTVDTDQTITATNPMPGSGNDGGDNVEQVRSTTAGTQVLKVKNQGSIDGLAAEPFSVASANPLTPLGTPIPTVELSTNLSVVQSGSPVTVTAEVENTSNDIDLSAAQVTLNLPSGVNLISGVTSQNVTLTAGDSDTAVWQVEGTSEGLKNLDANVDGSAFGESFTSSDSANVTIDDTPPTVTVEGPSPWSAEANIPFTWSGVDSVDVADYDVEVSRNGGAFEILLGDTVSTTTSVLGNEGETIAVRVTANDAAGNSSAPATHTTVVDAIPPRISLTPTFPTTGTAVVEVGVSNVGSPVTATYFFGVGNGAHTPLFGSSVVYTNLTASIKTASVRVIATDAVGRSVSAAADIPVPSSLRSPRLKITSAKAKNGRLLIRGRAAKTAPRRVALVVERIGKAGTRRKRIRAILKNGKFSARIRLAPGRYRLTASLPQSTTHRATKTSKRTRIE